DPVALKKQRMELLEARGAAVPAEHNYGRLYRVPEEMEAHFKELDPCNVFNPGAGETSPRKNWAQARRSAGCRRTWARPAGCRSWACGRSDAPGTVGRSSHPHCH